MTTPVGFDDLFREDVDEAEAVEASEPEARQVRPWWGPPEDELGVAVPQGLILARSGRGVVALSHVLVYSTGAEFQFVAKGHGLKHSQVQAIFHSLHHLDPDEGVPDTYLRIGLELADGTRVSNLGGRRRDRRRWVDEEPDRPVFLEHGGGGGSGNDHGISMQPGYWLWPAPAPGPLRIWCEWPVLEIGLESAEIDGSRIAEAASRPIALWDDRA